MRFAAQLQAIFIGAIAAGILLVPLPVLAACKDCGRVTSVALTTTEGKASGVGAVTGGVGGAVVGHQFGSGRGKHRHDHRGCGGRRICRAPGREIHEQEKLLAGQRRHGRRRPQDLQLRRRTGVQSWRPCQGARRKTAADRRKLNALNTPFAPDISASLATCLSCRASAWPYHPWRTVSSSFASARTGLANG